MRLEGGVGVLTRMDGVRWLEVIEVEGGREVEVRKTCIGLPSSLDSNRIRQKEGAFPTMPRAAERRGRFGRGFFSLLVGLQGRKKRGVRIEEMR
jgi:hypothetical protein